MAKECAVTGKSRLTGGKYSNRIRATQFNPTGKKVRRANLQTKRIFVEETGKTYRVVLSTRAIKTINKHGAYKVLKEAGVINPKKVNKSTKKES